MKTTQLLVSTLLALGIAAAAAHAGGEGAAPATTQGRFEAQLDRAIERRLGPDLDVLMRVAGLPPARLAPAGVEPPTPPEPGIAVAVRTD